MSGKSKLYKEYDDVTGELIKKECSKCHEIKDISCFSKDKNLKDGHENRCKECKHNTYNKNKKCNDKKILYREYDMVTGDLIKLECGKCHEIKDISCFHKSKDKKDGVRTQCKECCKGYIENHKEEKSEYYRQYHENHKEEKHEYGRQYRENHKEEKHEYNIQYRENKAQQEIMKIYEKVTKQLYPHKSIQYGVIYGVHCKDSNRWYIGQTETSFNIRYHGNFFKNKYNALSKDNVKRQLLADDIEKCGQESFEIFEVIDIAFSERELDEKEAYYIDYYKAYDEGYNSNRGYIFKHGKEKRKCCCE